MVDDSAFMRKLLTEVIESDPGCHVIGTARDGIGALKAAENLKPDVITLDIELPEIDGLAVLVYIMEQFPTPVVMVTGFSRFLGEETIKALEYGAVGLVRKPEGPISKNAWKIKEELISQIKIAAQVDVKKMKRENETRPRVTTTDRIVVIGASSGGPRALTRVIPGLPGALNAGVVVIQHMSSEFLLSLAERLDWKSALEVKMRESSEPIRNGTVQMVPGGSSIDAVMESLAPVYGRNTIGVVLTGMGNDGTEGLRVIKEHGGYTIAEDESTAVVFGMPGEAIKAGVVDKILPLGEIADEIIRVVNG